VPSIHCSSVAMAKGHVPHMTIKDHVSGLLGAMDANCILQTD
jgi:hypothetical protein